MADENNFNMPPQGFDPNRPRLKKVKRPVKRIMPHGNQQPILNQTSPFQQTGSFSNANIRNETDFNLDGYLDETNLPSINNYQTNRYEPEREEAQFISEEELDAEYGIHRGELPAFLTRNVAILLAIVLFFTGFLIAKFFFANQKIVRNGLQGVIINPEVPQGRARCGIAEKTQGCVLYIMNPQRQELNARDFYDLASQLTGRQRFVIETGNMRYSNVKVRPGDIVQLNIPPL